MSENSELQIANSHSFAHPRHRVVLLLLILLAFALRIYRLDAQSFWYDEGVSATVAQYDLATLTAWTANDIQPPLYYYALAGWGRVAGWNEWSVRFLSVFWGVLTVPLLAVLAQLLSRSRVAEVVSLLLTALHPLFLYYSQEARMYTMLVALGVLAGYALWRVQQADVTDRQPLNWWIVYVLSATAAVYTHYFAFFLLFAFAISALFFSSGNSFLRHYVQRFLPANLLILLLYTPWFFALLRRLAVDTSYWQGDFKWWEAVRHVAITFAFGETVLETTAVRWLVIPMCITLLIGGLLFWRNWRVAGYALIWITIPVLCVLTLAWINPKFNARYTMVAMPGLILLWAVGIGDGRMGGWGDGALSRYRLREIFPVVFICLLVTPFAISIRNWFSDPAFTKAQWRELATYVKQNLQPGERVVLTSGHAWPIWHYYAPEIVPIRLPEIEILDVNAVLDYPSAAQTLQQQLGNATGTWLVNWQDEVVDPNGMAARVLSSIGQEQDVAVQFWQLHLHHYTNIAPQRIVLSPEITNITNFDFGGVIKLLGFSQSENGDLLLVWQRGDQSIPDGHDLLLTGEILTNENVPYGRLNERRPAAYEYPVSRWKKGEIVIGRIPLSALMQPGELPNSFQLALTLFDPQGDPAGFDVISETGQHIGKYATFGFAVSPTTPSSDRQDALTWPELLPNLHVKAELSASQIEFGSLLWADLYWYTTKSQPPIPFRVAVGAVSESKSMMQQQDRRAPLSAENVLPANQVLHQRIRLPRGKVGTHPVTLSAGLTSGSDSLLIGQVMIQTSERNFEIPTLSLLVNGEYYKRQPDGQIDNLPTLQLLGLLENLPAEVAANGKLSLSLVWQASFDSTDETPDYALSMQLLDVAGNLVVQKDEKIASGTASWLKGQVETQVVELAMPAEAGSYRLVAIVYDPTAPGLPRLLTQTGDSVEITLVQISE